MAIPKRKDDKKALPTRHGWYVSLFDYKRFYGDSPQVVPIFSFNGKHWYKDGKLIDEKYIPQDLEQIKQVMR